MLLAKTEKAISEKVMIWGRPFDVYVEMFDLSKEDLKKRIVDCGSGPASFNAGMNWLGGHMISVDPIYCLSSDEIRREIIEARNLIYDEIKGNPDYFVLDKYHNSPEEYCQVHMDAMEGFLSDYNNGLIELRYLYGRLPELPFSDGEFDIALCSNLLFSYSRKLSFEFHIQSIMELCRVSAGARIYPATEAGFTGPSSESKYLGAVLDRLKGEGYRADVVRVPYEFRKSASEMLRVTAV